MASDSLKKTRVLELIRQERFGEAKRLVELSLGAETMDASWWELLGVIYGMLNNPREAEHCAREAIHLEPDRPESHNNLGLALRSQGKYDEALASLREAIRLKSDYTDAYYNLGTTLAGQNKLEEAVASYRQALAVNPKDADIWNDLGVALYRLQRYQEAVECGRHATKLNPNHHLAYFNLGNALIDISLIIEAIDSYRHAIRLKPDFAEGYYNLGEAFRTHGQLQEAIDCYRTAIRYKPEYAEAHFNLSVTYLLLGKFEDGWNEYAWHWQRKTAHARPYPPTPWKGAALLGQDVFLYSEQGLGDEIFFLRFVPWLKRCGARRVVYRPNQKIASLIARVPFLNHVARPEERPANDAVIFSVGDLPRLLRMKNTGEIPPPIPLVPRVETLSELRIRLLRIATGPYIGITWRAGVPKKENALFKDAPLEFLAKVLSRLNVTVLILQRHPAPGEIETFQEALGRPAHDLSVLNDDLEQMLALLALIDDYVGVSNTNMHLRAGVGKSARVLVPSPPEWRWMSEGKESPWFPNFTVYRQGYDGSWAEPFDMLRADLETTYGI